MERKGFLKKVCLIGTCLAGFDRVSLSQGSVKNNIQNDNGCLLQQTWISEMLKQASSLDEEKMIHMLKNLSVVHFNQLQMDNMLAPYKGNLESFIGFIEEKWGWKIFYDKENKTIVADENKDYCVCPMINHDMENASLMCHCSEGFAEKMFSMVTGENAKAVVISSVLRGNKSCKYQINF